MARYLVEPQDPPPANAPESDQVANRGAEPEPSNTDPSDDIISLRTSDREELIQCIKRGQRPTWVPKTGLEALCAEVNAEQSRVSPSNSHLATAHGNVPNNGEGEHEGEGGGEGGSEAKIHKSIHASATDSLRRSLSTLRTSESHAATGVPIPRRSSSLFQSPEGSFDPDYTISPPPWNAASPYSFLRTPQNSSPAEQRRSRAPSLGSSLSSSFVMRVPTSPLVNAMNNPSLDFSPRDGHDVGGGRTPRRRTMPPNAFESFSMSPLDTALPTASQSFRFPQTGLEGRPIRSAHQPRRSLSSFTYQPATSPQTAFPPRARRPSLVSDGSPRRASMVGSFEESILRGRMSTPASKPLDFVAQIGVLGRGDCPASLKCPAHVTVPFPAVFYNYASSNEARTISDDNPSPYVGTIDLEHNLKPPTPPTRRTRRSQVTLDPDALMAEITSPENTHIGKALARAERRDKKKHEAPSTPTGGAYRVPQQGQLQIIIKNPNKTAVKLFLVPYDLTGMLPGSKTFVRQRSYSSGPIIEGALVNKASVPLARDPLVDKDILRYLVHLKFCSTSRGRYYIYDNIRVVFANRVPDNKEKLRLEVQVPEPRFSAYKPIEIAPRVPALPHATISLQATRTASCDNSDGGIEQEPAPFHISPISNDSKFSDLVAAQTETVYSQEEAAMGSQLERAVSPTPGFRPSTSARNSPVPWLTGEGPGPGRSFSPAPVESGDGLLSRKLRELNGGMQ